MSDRQSKNSNGATKAFFSSVSGRTRSKRDAYYDAIAESRGISSRTRNLAAANASHESGGVSAPIARRKETKIVGKLRGYSSSHNSVEDTDLEGESASDDDCIRLKNRRRRGQLKPRRRVGRPKSKFGNNSAHMDIKEADVEIIDEAEFKRRKICSASKIGHSSRQESYEGFSTASSRKNVDILSKKPSAGLDYSPDHVSHDSDQEFRVPKGNGNKDTDSEGIEIERIEEADFMNLKTNLMSNIGSSSKEVPKEGYSTVTPRKDVNNASRKASSADYFESSYPENACHGFEHAWPYESSSFVQKGSDSEDMVPEEIKIEKIDEAEFRNQKTRSESKIGRSAEQGPCAASSRKNVDGASKYISSADNSVSFAPRDYRAGSDALVDDSSSLPKRGNKNEPKSCRGIKIKQIDEAEFRNGKSSMTSKIGSSTRQGYSAGNPRENACIVKEALSDNYCGPFSSKDAGRDSDKGLTDKSSSFAEKGNEEDTDSENLGIEKIDESEFRNESTHFVSKIGSSTRQERDGGHIAATSGKNVKSVSRKISYIGKFDKNKKKRKVSSHSRRKKKGEAWNRNLRDDLNNSSFEYISSYSSSESDNDNINNSLQDDEGAQHGINLGIASRTRSKMNTKTPAEVGNFSLGLSLDSESSSFFSVSSFEEESSGNFDGIEFLGSCVGEVQNNISMEVSTKESEDCSKQKSSAVKHAPNRRHLNLQNQESTSTKESEDRIKLKSSAVKHAPNRRQLNLQNKESNCEQPTIQKQEFSSRKRQLSDDASSKQTKGVKAQKTSEVHEENEVLDRTFGDDANAEEGLQERFACSKQSCAQNNCNEAKGVNGLHARDQSQAGMRRQKKEASPSNSKDDCHHSDDNEDDNVDDDEEDDCDEAKGVNGLHPKDQSQAGMRRQKKEASPFNSKDDRNHSNDNVDGEDIHEKIEAASSDSHGHGKTDERVNVTDEIKDPMRKQASSKHYGFCSMLADAVLGRGPILETEGSDEEAKQVPVCQTQNALPLKFRFEDEIQIVVEKTEAEEEIEGLFAELDAEWALKELGTFNYHKADEEDEDAPAEETHHARCAKGKHELVLQDDQGLICIFCHHVELGPKDILPEWVEKIHQDSERKRYSETEQILEFDGLDFQSSINNVADFGNRADGTVWSIKPGRREGLYKHQQEGFEFLWKNLAGSINLDELKSTDPGRVGGCIISHAPGTGKSKLTVVFIETYLRMFPNCRPVIIGPASMLLTWEEEFRKWNIEVPFFNLNNPDCLGKENKTLELLGGAKRRNMEVIRMVKISLWSKGKSVLGISYSLFEKLTGEKYIKGKKSKKKETLDDQEQKLRTIFLEKPGLVVLDEGHTPRNQRSNIWNALLKLQTEKRVILSGTPFQNNFAELFNTLRLVRPAIAGELAKEKTFAEMIASRRMSSSRNYRGEHSQSHLIPEEVDRAVDRLKISMSPFVNIHKGSILQQNLPGLRDCVVLLKPAALQKSLIERLEGLPNSFEFEHKAALISVHPYLFQHPDSTEEQRIGIDMGAIEASKLNPNEGVKTKFIVELVRLSILMEEKVLIFSQYIQPLKLIKEQLKEYFKWTVGKQILQLQGKMEQKQRQTLINLFNDKLNESKVMLASMRCCSEGISLIGASRVVLLDVVWNPSVERQAICRAYRIGQMKFVYTYHLMTSGMSEAKKYCRQAEKERLSELVFSSSNETNKEKHNSLGIEDRILEEMVGHENLKEMFEKIINQPKDTDLIQSFGLTS